MNMLVHDLGQPRGACDRCHGQKLRCRRENQNEDCLRCQRAGARCTPRTARSRQRRHSHATQQVRIHGNSPPPYLVSSATELSSKDGSDNFGLSPGALLDLPPDMDLGLEFSSLQSEYSPSWERRDLQSGVELGILQSQPPSPSFAQSPPPHARSGGRRPEQENQNELHGSYNLSSSASTMTHFSSVPSPNHSRHRLSLARDMTPRSLNYQSQQEEENSHLMNFDQREGTIFHNESEDNSPDSGYGSRRRESIRSDTQSLFNTGQQQSTKPIVNPVMTSWIRRLSDINMELHQHMLSIPPIEIEQQNTWTNSKDKRTPAQHDQELAVDGTFKLSHQYIEILNDIFYQTKSPRQTHAGGPTTDALKLDQPCQLLVLSSYLCLIESYDKILQHIKTWTEVRLKMGTSPSASDTKNFPIQLPSVAVGSFRFPNSSSTRPLVMTCILEAMIMQIHDLVSEMMRAPANMRNGTGAARMSNGAAAAGGGCGGEQSTSAENGVSGVAKETLQAIRGKEDSTMKLIHVVWRLALRCGAV